jgi:hypothetical protein
MYKSLESFHCTCQCDQQHAMCKATELGSKSRVDQQLRVVFTVSAYAAHSSL